MPEASARPPDADCASPADSAADSTPCVTLQQPLPFGGVVVGKPQTQFVQVHNCGAAPLAITAAQVSPLGVAAPGEFSVHGSAPLATGWVGPGSLSAANPQATGAGGAVALDVTYSPADATPNGQLDQGQLP